MSDPAPKPNPAPPESTSREEFEDLRTLLLRPEQEEIDRLRRRLDHGPTRADEVSRILPEAVQQASARDERLSQALFPTVENAIHVSAKHNPRVLADALFPVMGPAIRKSITAAIRGMVQALQQALDRSLSPRALRWRIEAWRTRRPFAEVVLLHSLVYRVEQALLIHKETGLLLQHVVAEPHAGQDGDMVSGMLTAIQDFVRDSFSEGGAGDDVELDTLQLGDLTVLVQQGPVAALVAVVRGTPPPELRELLQDTIERIHGHFGDPLAEFDGDPAPFEPTRPQLEECLVVETRPTRGKPWRLAAILGVIVLALVALWIFFSVRAEQRWSDYLAKLRATPGLVVTSAEERGGKYHLVGLRDPRAPDPRALLKTSPLDPEDVVQQWVPYHSLEPRFVLERARIILAPPPSVQVVFAGGVLSLRGLAAHQWAVRARLLAHAVPGVNRVDARGLVDRGVREYDELKRTIEKHALTFAVGRAVITPEHRPALREIAATIPRLLESARMLGRFIRIELVGHADHVGSDEANQRLSRARAEAVRTWLVRSGAPPSFLVPYWFGSRIPLAQERSDTDRARNRRVSLRVVQITRFTLPDDGK